MSAKEKRNQIIAMLYQNMSKHEAYETLQLIDELCEIQKPTSENAKALDLLEVVPCCSEFEIDFDGNLKTKIEINDNVPTVIAAVNGWGESVNVEATIITQLQ